MTETPMWPAERMVAWARRRPVAVDLALALLAALIGLALAAYGHSTAYRWNAESVAALAAALPLPWRRRWPFPSAAGVAVAVVLASAFGAGVVAAGPAILVAAYSVTVYGPRWAGPVAAIVMLAGAIVPAAVSGLGNQVLLISLVIGALLAACVWLTGALRRAGLRTRRQEVRLELVAERSRISAEVHDVVAHSLTGIVVQADGGRLVAAKDPERAAEVLAGIGETGRAALAEIRGLLAVLHEQVDRPLGPGDVATLVERAGPHVRLETSGTPRPLPPEAALAAYRTAQEGLTNVGKHAGPEVPTVVVLGWGDDGLTVEVRDRGGRPATVVPSGGHGLTGLRARLGRVGGTLDAEHLPDGGFALRGRIPA